MGKGIPNMSNVISVNGEIKSASETSQSIALNVTEDSTYLPQANNVSDGIASANGLPCGTFATRPAMENLKEDCTDSSTCFDADTKNEDVGTEKYFDDIINDPESSMGKKITDLAKMRNVTENSIKREIIMRDVHLTYLNGQKLDYDNVKRIRENIIDLKGKVMAFYPYDNKNSDYYDFQQELSALIDDNQRTELNNEEQFLNDNPNMLIDDAVIDEEITKILDEVSTHGTLDFDGNRLTSEDYFQKINDLAKELQDEIHSINIPILNISFWNKYQKNDIYILLILKDVHDLAVKIKNEEKSDNQQSKLSLLETKQLIDKIRENIDDNISKEIKYCLRRDLSEIIDYPENLIDMIVRHGMQNPEYKLCEEDKIKYHMYGFEGEYNLKFESINENNEPDGYVEVVYKIDGKRASLFGNTFDRANAGMIKLETNDTSNKVWGEKSLASDIENKINQSEMKERYLEVSTEINNRVNGEGNVKKYSERQKYFFNFENARKSFKQC